MKELGLLLKHRTLSTFMSLKVKKSSSENKEFCQPSGDLRVEELGLLWKQRILSTFRKLEVAGVRLALKTQNSFNLKR